MKKLVAILLSVMLMMGLMAPAMADDVKEFDSSLVGIFEYSADEWYSSEFNRALLTISLFLDYSVQVDSEAASGVNFVTEKSYVGTKDGNMIVVINVNSQYLLMTFSPATPEKVFYAMTSEGSSAVEAALTSQGYTYEANSTSSIQSAIELFQEVFSGN